MESFKSHYKAESILERDPKLRRTEPARLADAKTVQQA